MNYYSIYYILLLIFINLRLIEFSIAQTLEDLLNPKCDDKYLNYSIIANLEEYLKYQNNIDGREMFNSKEIFKHKKLGTISGTYYNKTIYKSVKEYDTYDQLFGDLRTLKIDGVIQPDKYAEDIQFFSDDLALFPKHIQINKIGFGIQKNNDLLKDQINQFIENHKDFHEERISVWSRLNFDEKHIDTQLTGNKGTLNVVIRFANYPYSYKENNEIMGSEIEFLYLFAKEYGYNIILKEVDTYEEQFESLKNKSADLAAGYFIIRDNNEINFSNVIYESKVYIIVRYSNLPESIEFKIPHNSVDQFNGENIGLLVGSSFNNLTKEIFTKSKFKTFRTVSELYYHLLMKDIEGFLIDDIITQNYQLEFNNKLTYYRLEGDIENAFAFQKNANGVALLNQFNEFLKTIKFKELYNKWNILDTSKLSFDKTLNKNGKTLNVALCFQLKPFCFMEKNEPKGLEPEILYLFARINNYNINLIDVNLEERISFIKEGKANISGGIMSVTDERKQTVNFCNSLYTIGTALAVRIDSRKDMIEIKILDHNYKEKSNNTSQLQVKFSDSNKISSCIFPDKYNETIIINCTISDLNHINVSKGFEFVDTSDKINILYKNLELNNFFQANSKISGHNTIIIEGNKDNIICNSSFSWTNGSLIASLLINISLLAVLMFSRYL